MKHKYIQAEWELELFNLNNPECKPNFDVSKFQDSIDRWDFVLKTHDGKMMAVCTAVIYYEEKKITLIIQSPYNLEGYYGSPVFQEDTLGTIKIIGAFIQNGACYPGQAKTIKKNSYICETDRPIKEKK